MPDRAVDPQFPDLMRRLLEQRGVSYRTLAARTYHAKSYLHDLATGRKTPTPAIAKRIDDALGAAGELTALVGAPGREPDGLELARRVAATDLGVDTLDRLDLAVDDLAVAYASSPPLELAAQIRQHLAYVGRLLDVRKTLAQQRRLLVAGGWLSLLGGTVDIDRLSLTSAGNYLTAARHMAEQADHPEMLAWVHETRAWDALTAKDYRRAVDLSRQAQAVAPRGSSAHIQATAQEGRAWARMGQAAETRDALARTARLVSPLAPPARPDHHYQYDPGKALAYVATTLSWVADPAAEQYARTVVSQLVRPSDGGAPRLRRAALARVDLALALLAAGKADEAAATALVAVTSGRLVRSNWWRATEVLAGVERAGTPGAVDLRDAYEAHRPASS